MTHNILAALIASAGLVAVAIPSARAGSGDEAAEAVTLQSARMSAAEASQAALARFPGTVSSVQIYADAGKPAFHVEVVGTDGSQQDQSHGRGRAHGATGVDPRCREPDEGQPGEGELERGVEQVGDQRPARERG